MRSLPKVIKPGGAHPSDEVYRIPDFSSQPFSEPGEEEEAASTAQETEEEREAQFLLRMHIMEERTRSHAEEVAQKILQNANNERNQILEQAQSDAGRLRREARDEAYQTAYEEHKAEIQGCLRQVDGLMEQLQQDHRNFTIQYEQGLTDLALDIAEKVMDESIAEHRELMIPLVNKAVSTVKNAEWISVEVSSQLPGLVEELKKEMAKRQGSVVPEILGADLSPGGCIVHTPQGIIDASVSSQMEKLREILEENR
ncbi:MAG: hypothetical protein HFJ86_11495 [Oscillospiraceae bacterium]|nr:hypothetical protein [Oscillospiraceae bacterium]